MKEAGKNWRPQPKQRATAAAPGGTEETWSSRLGRRFGDEIAAAMIDRVVHHADVLTVPGAGCRLRGRGIDSLTSIRTQNQAD